MLPIVERELRVASRRKGIYRARILTGLLSGAFIGFLLFLASASSGFAYRGGEYVFATLIYLALIFCGLESVRKMADAISEEKREGTLGLLFLTDLTGRDIILGKLAAHSLRSFHVLLAFLPVLATTLLLGGVTLGEFGRASIILVNALFVSLVAGLWVSTLSRERSTTNTLGLLFLLMVLPGFASIAIRLFDPNIGLIAQATSPFGALPLARDGTYQQHIRELWWGVLILHLLGWIFLLHASWLVRWVWQDKPIRETKGRSIGPPTQRLERRRALLDKNPALWLAYNERDARHFNVLFFVMFAGFFIAALFFETRIAGTINSIGTFLAVLLLKIYLASQSSKHLAEARKNGALELMLSTPLSVDSIIGGQRLALRKMFLPAAIVALTWHLYAAFAFERSFALLGLGMLDFPFAVFAIGSFGMWMGMRYQSVNGAFFRTLLYTVVIPSLPIFIFCCLPKFLFYGIIIGISSGRLRAEFRNLAGEKVLARFAAPPVLSSSAPPLIRS
jgi:ABC-type transport system involved in multi-copper enzyme maturation permease subunit